MEQDRKATEIGLKGNWVTCLNSWNNELIKVLRVIHYRILSKGSGSYLVHITLNSMKLISSIKLNNSKGNTCLFHC